LNLGFETVKDLLDVLIIPIVIFVVGALLPTLFDAVKARKFLGLIKRELDEMAPKGEKKTEGGKWHQHLVKRFIHEEIFAHISENRDFILSLPPDISYNMAQLWIHFHKATESRSESDLAEHGASWCDYLRGLCCIFDRGKEGHFYIEIYQPWEKLILEYHPNLRKSERLPATCSRSETSQGARNQRRE
jgi:hypothetical protein